MFNEPFSLKIRINDEKDQLASKSVVELSDGFGSKFLSHSRLNLAEVEYPMQRTASQRKAKKVAMPSVPDLIKSGNFSVSTLGHNHSRKKTAEHWCSSSNLRNTFGTFGTNKDHCHSGLTPARMNQHKSDFVLCLAASSRVGSKMEDGQKLSLEMAEISSSNMKTNDSSNYIQTKDLLRNRNSTSSSSSSHSSGFESMKDIVSLNGNRRQDSASASCCSSTTTNGSGGRCLSNLTSSSSLSSRNGGGSPPCRNSLHSSSGGSSLGSLERLDETGPCNGAMNLVAMISSGLPEEEIIFLWLKNLSYEDYAPMFINAGYDLSTITRMTPQDLTAIGITKPGHRKRLTTEIRKMKLQDQWPCEMPESLTDWLIQIRLDFYAPIFSSQSLVAMVQILEMSWEDFEEIGITKLGHLKRLICAIRKLKDNLQKKRNNSIRLSAKCLLERQSTTEDGQILQLVTPGSPGITGHRSTYPIGNNVTTFQTSSKFKINKEGSEYDAHYNNHRCSFQNNINNYDNESLSSTAADKAYCSSYGNLFQRDQSDKCSNIREAIVFNQHHNLNNSYHMQPYSASSSNDDQKSYTSSCRRHRQAKSTTLAKSPKLSTPTKRHVFQLSTSKFIDQNSANDSRSQDETLTIDYQSVGDECDGSLAYQFPPPPEPITCQRQIEQLRAMKCLDRSSSSSLLSITDYVASNFKKTDQKRSIFSNLLCIPPNDDSITNCNGDYLTCLNSFQKANEQDDDLRVMASTQVLYQSSLPSVAAATFPSSSCQSVMKTQYDLSNKTLKINDGKLYYDSQTEPLPVEKIDDSLPFAQDDVGTIRQKSDQKSKRHTFSRYDGNVKLEMTKCPNNETDSRPITSVNNAVLNDIGHMLQNLTDELDALLFTSKQDHTSGQSIQIK